MLCSGCGKDRPEKDFFGKETCYRCKYQEKLNQIDPKKIKKCRQCFAPLRSNRWIYCSQACAHLGERKLKREYWTNQL
jgi:hypothetical protein